jgi:hypothetical protein
MDPKLRPNHQLYLEALRRLTPEQRLLKAFELTELSRELLRAELRQRFAEADVARVMRALSAPERHLDEHAVRGAARRRAKFDLIDSSSGDKADSWLLTDEPFDRERFSRRRRVKALGLEVTASAPEDTILMKLRWPAGPPARLRPERREAAWR